MLLGCFAWLACCAVFCRYTLQLPFSLPVQRIALQIHQDVAVVGKAVHMARSVVQVAHLPQALQGACLPVSKHS